MVASISFLNPNIIIFNLLRKEKNVCKISFFYITMQEDARTNKNLGRKVEVTIQFRKKGAWSNLFDACQCCNTTAKRHFAKGLCEACYARAYRDAVKKKKVMDGDNK